MCALSIICTWCQLTMGVMTWRLLWIHLGSGRWRSVSALSSRDDVLLMESQGGSARSTPTQGGPALVLFAVLTISQPALTRITMSASLSHKPWQCRSLTIHSAPPSLQNSGITWVAPLVTCLISSWTRLTAHQTNRPCPQMKLIFISSPLPTLCRKTSTQSSYGTTINTRSTKSFSSSAIRRTTIAKRQLQWHTPSMNLAMKSST